MGNKYFSLKETSNYIEAKTGTKYNRRTITRWVKSLSIAVKDETGIKDGNKSWLVDKNKLRKIFNKELFGTQDAIKYVEEKSGRRVSKVTIATWSKDFGIGRKICGTWFVSKEGLDKIIDGEYRYEKNDRW